MKSSVWLKLPMRRKLRKPINGRLWNSILTVTKAIKRKEKKNSRNSMKLIPFFPTLLNGKFTIAMGILGSTLTEECPTLTQWTSFLKFSEWILEIFLEVVHGVDLKVADPQEGVMPSWNSLSASKRFMKE
jgi:hypothetical protein